MQIVESTVYGVRSAIYHLEPRGEGPAFALYPMIHIGERTFYEDISRRLSECDLILYEGVKVSKSAGPQIPYKAISRNPRVNLVSQHTMDMSHLREKLVHADVPAEAFIDRWRSIPFWKRLYMRLSNPFLYIMCRYFFTRSILAKHLGLTLRRTRDEILDDDDDPIEDIIIDWRDNHLIGLIEKHRSLPENAEHLIGVLYGARHMRAVLKYLMIENDYRVAKAEWTLVFST